MDSMAGLTRLAVCLHDDHPEDLDNPFSAWVIVPFWKKATIIDRRERTTGSGTEKKTRVQFLMALKPIWLDQEDVEQANSDLLRELEAQWTANAATKSGRRNATPQKRRVSSPDRSSKRCKSGVRTSRS